MSTSQRLTGAALVAGVAGQPIAHSLSPVIHNAWLAVAEMDGVYVPFSPANEAGFAALVAAGRSGLIRGLNVTAPFKEQAFALADEATEAAKSVSSANILVFEKGRVKADSSDGVGVLYALKDQAPQLDLRGAKIVMLGAGGAARASAGALIAAGAQIGILNRTRSRAEALVADLGGAVQVVDTSALAGADLVINALSVQPEIDLAQVKASAVVMDMTYRPVITPFLQAARTEGLTTVDGLAMLIGQAEPSFVALYGQAAPRMDMRQLLLEHLGEVA